MDKVTKMAYSMVTVYGMNDALGLLSYNQNSGEQFYKPYSEDPRRTLGASFAKLGSGCPSGDRNNLDLAKVRDSVTCRSLP